MLLMVQNAEQDKGGSSLDLGGWWWWWVAAVVVGGGGVWRQ